MLFPILFRLRLTVTCDTTAATCVTSGMIDQYEASPEGAAALDAAAVEELKKVATHTRSTTNF